MVTVRVSRYPRRPYHALRKILALVHPVARVEQLELHRSQSALPAVAFGEVEQLAR